MNFLLDIVVCGATICSIYMDCLTHMSISEFFGARVAFTCIHVFGRGNHVVIDVMICCGFWLLLWWLWM